MSKFKIEIELGNEAMRTTADVARAVRKIAERLEKIRGTEVNMLIRDDNGNHVGLWSLVLPEEE